MNFFERSSVAIRHAPGLDRADWLWKRLRPVYDRVVSAVATSRGLERTINRTDTFRLSPLSRWFVDEDYEPEIWARAMREVRTGDRVVEVGASFGLYALAFAGRVGATGHVTAFEPDPASAAALQANVEVNGWRDRVSLIRAAVGAVSAQVAFASDNGFESRVQTRIDSSTHTINVPMVTLDDALGDFRIDILKIDVEGFEQQVLEGARTILGDATRRPRAIVVEVHPFAWGETGAASAAFLEILESSGYRVETAGGKPVRAITDYGHVIAIHHEPRPQT